MDEVWTGILEALREHADELPLDDFAAHMKGRETEYEQLLTSPSSSVVGTWR